MRLTAETFSYLRGKVLVAESPWYRGYWKFIPIRLHKNGKKISGKLQPEAVDFRLKLKKFKWYSFSVCDPIEWEIEETPTTSFILED